MFRILNRAVLRVEFPSRKEILKDFNALKDINFHASKYAANLIFSLGRSCFNYNNTSPWAVLLPVQERKRST
ncbi:hypothetical protein NPIL_371311 [Nephila pilipes]|uniref:Uncharacterized protein n=1 Tax=Nephila pilipes TaxID=299642 RepID=A0A8X6UJA8_NEPPI|nr:hypothetical protein NPIL_371311 [Nephila pilipes]